MKNLFRMNDAGWIQSHIFRPENTYSEYVFTKRITHSYILTPVYIADMWADSLANLRLRVRAPGPFLND